MRDAPVIAAAEFDALLRPDTRIEDVERVLGEPRNSGGIMDAADDGTAIDLPRLDYALVIKEGSTKASPVFISFWFQGTQLKAAFLRDPRTMTTLKRLFPPLAAEEPNQPPEPTPTSVTIRACARLAPAAVVAHL